MRNRLQIPWLAVLLLGTPPALAQDTTGKLCEALTQEDTRVVAKAAADARLVKERAVTLALRRALDRWAKEERANAEVVRLFLLDALVEHGAKIPGDQLLPMLDDPLTEIPALVLLCREPAMNEAVLLDLFEQRYTPGNVGTPAGGLTAASLAHSRRNLLGNLLCLRRAKGFAANLWGQANRALEVTARDPAGAAQGSVTFQLPEVRGVRAVVGFPELPVYRLVEQRPTTDPAKRMLRPSTSLLTSWPTQIEFSRDGKTEMPLELAWLDVQREAEWLALMAGETEDNLRGLRSLSVVYRTDAQFVTEVTAARARFETAKKTLRDALVTRGALTAEEAKKCDVSIEIAIEDRRDDRSKPLPEIPVAK